MTEAFLVEQEKWFCPADSCQKACQKSFKISDEYKKGSKTLAPEALEKRLKVLGKEQKAKEKEIEIERIPRKKRIEMDRFFFMLERTLRDE